MKLLVSRENQPEDTLIRLSGAQFGGGRFTVIAGPCAVESSAQLRATAEVVRDAGASLLRGGAFKPRTSPYSFRGLGRAGLGLLVEARAAVGLPTVSEAVDTDDLAAVAAAVDVIQIGARNMQNFSLLEAAGRLRQPVLLKRGAGATLDELLQAAEYLLQGGNRQVLLCERGIRTFAPSMRYTLDLAGVVRLKQLTHLPVLVDPSHATGDARLVPALARAALAAGADGLLVEVHAQPEAALSDGPQALLPEAFRGLMASLRQIGTALGRAV